MYREAILDIINQYKAKFPVHRPEELYKWKAVKCYQDNWDSSDENFSSMLNRAFGKDATSMLDSYSAYPRAMICRMAEKEPETVRAMFLMLGDESQPIADRIKSFSEQAEELRKAHNPGHWNNHYQTPTSI